MLKPSGRYRTTHRTRRTIRQIPLSGWPLGVSEHAALLKATPAQIASKTRISFKTDHDDLDWFQAAIITTNNQSTVALQSYRNAPSGGTSLITHVDACDALIDVVSQLHLKKSDFLWIAPWAEDAIAKGLKRQSMEIAAARDIRPKAVGFAAAYARKKGRF